MGGPRAAAPGRGGFCLPRLRPTLRARGSCAVGRREDRAVRRRRRARPGMIPRLRQAGRPERRCAAAVQAFKPSDARRREAARLARSSGAARAGRSQPDRCALRRRQRRAEHAAAADRVGRALDAQDERLTVHGRDGLGQQELSEARRSRQGLGALEQGENGRDLGRAEMELVAVAVLEWPGCLGRRRSARR